MNLRKALFEVYWKLERRIVPGLRYSQYEYEDTLFLRAPREGAWLDLGCGHALLPPWRLAQEQDLVSCGAVIVGLDPDYSALQLHRSIKRRVAGDCSQIPFADESFDLVTANMVVEHLPHPEAQFREILRVLKPGGRFLFHTPNALGYPTMIAKSIPDFLKKKLALWLEDRAENDVYPTHYRANSKSRIVSIARQSGFQSAELSFVCTTAAFALIPPVALLELFFIRALRHRSMEKFRPVVIAYLSKGSAKSTEVAKEHRAATLSGANPCRTSSRTSKLAEVDQRLESKSANS